MMNCMKYDRYMELANRPAVVAPRTVKKPGDVEFIGNGVVYYDEQGKPIPKR